MAGQDCILIGNESLLTQCGEELLARGGRILRVVTRSDDIAAWARGKGIAVEAPGPDLAGRLRGVAHDWLLSIANLDMLPPEVLALPARGALNFHDGPLPAYAGLNAPVWALWAGERRYGITWHVMEEGADTGDIVAQEMFDIAPDETALTLNAKCYEAGLRAFGRVLEAMRAPALPRVAQNPSGRSYFARDRRPPALGRLDFTRPAAELARQVRALDHGGYANPVSTARIAAGGRVWLVGRALVEAGRAGAAPGEVLDIRADRLVVATGEGALELSALKSATGVPVEVVDFVRVGEVLPSPSAEEVAALDGLARELAPHEGYWRDRLSGMRPAVLAMAGAARAGEVRMQAVELPAGLEEAAAGEVLARFAARLAEACDEGTDIAFADADLLARPEGYAAPWVPLRVPPEEGRDLAALLAEARAHKGFFADLTARMAPPAPLRVPDVGLVLGAGEAVPGCALTLALEGRQVRLIADRAAVDAGWQAMLAGRLAAVLEAAARRPDDPRAAVRAMAEDERAQLIAGFNRTEAPITPPPLIHAAFEEQAARTPEAVALVFEGTALSYGALNAAANRAAHVLRAMGVEPGQPVALHLRRGPDMVVGMLAILKAGGAYVPLDPAFPPARLAHYLADSGARVVVSEAALAGTLEAGARLELDRDPRLAEAPDTNPGVEVSPDDLAYVIYTSGSTGTPKGVMVEHGNVANFFTGMDAVIHRDGDGRPGVWLAVTSVSFDISVLELLWTLARGFKVVLAGDEARLLGGGGGPVRSDRHMDFSIFYWGNDDGPGPRKYQMLLDGARFADRHGFRAIWTPERHFHAFGGPYPNPAVTGAAVAAVTSNIDVRSGSVVAPLHHPARIAEEWAVIDNLTNGRAGLGIAAGWQPHDFVLRPENAPPDNKRAMYRAIEQIRALWRGEEVAFPLADGTPHKVLTQPRPVSKELPIWVTTAGNPDTWREAGEIGANVLTHLLGQSIREVGDKIEIYHDALRRAGHDPADFTVTLMLHTYLADSREAAEAAARGPMKDYLRSAAGLIKQFAWVFPAFKRPKGVSNPFELDLDVLSESELEEILEFAFLRYFEDSGLFGTVEDALARVEELKAIGVDEVACLIDYGIAPEKVLAGLEPLAEVVARANEEVTLAEGDYSLAAQIRRHHVSHLQMTPAMARMMLDDPATRGALGQVAHLYIGGEALPGALVRELGHVTSASVTNMYGPTETTVWSLSEPAVAGDGVVSIGRPIANTRAYVLDDEGQPLPVGMAGELWIGGAGVARGYWQRDDLTAQNFRPDPFAGTGRIYRTGDRVRRRADGRLDFLGRSDGQIKLRGYRIELGEIEARLAGLVGAGAQVAAVLREDEPGEGRIIAYVAGATVDEPALRRALARDLPDYMVPARIVHLEAMPLTPNRKIDRAALPDPAAGEPARSARAFAAPAGDAEARIAEIWSRILGVARIGANDNFFDLGGHSLLAVQAHREIRAALGVENLSITDIFRHPVLRDLAAMIEGRPDTPDDGAPDPGRAAQRAEAMARRRAMRAGRRR